MSDTLRMKADWESTNLTLADLNQYFNDIGFVGDEKPRLALSMASIRRKPVGVVSGSGTGKTALVDALSTLFRPNQIYSMEAGSEKAQVYSANEINNADLIYLTEIQKAGNGEVVIELLKNLGEGKDYTRKVTQSDKSVETQTIKKGKAIIYTKAIENKYETDDELDRRFSRFVTDMTKAQNERVVHAKAEKRMNPFKPHKLTDKQTNALRYHMAALLRENANNYVFINPMAEFLSKHIPTTFAVSRSYADHYFDFIEGVAFYNKRNRIIKTLNINGESKQVVFVSPEDCWQLHQIYSEQFLQDVLNIPPNGNHIFNVFREARKRGLKSNIKKGIFNDAPEENKVKLTIEQVANLLKDLGLVVKETLLQKLLMELQLAGYVREETTQVGAKKIVEYYLSDELVNFDTNINWLDAEREAVKNMKQYFPDVIQEYQSKYLNKSYVNPFTGENVKIQAVAPSKLDNRDDWLTAASG